MATQAKHPLRDTVTHGHSVKLPACIRGIAGTRVPPFIRGETSVLDRGAGGV